MKNLMVYINPRKDFDEEHKKLAKIQIDNLLSLGWLKDNILIVTNFEYSYNGIKALVVEDNNFCECSPTASKVKTILTLFDMNIIDDNIWWFHDFDAYQLHSFGEDELEIDDVDMALTDYGRMPNWSTGSWFFKKSSRDLFEMILEKVYELKTDEEKSLNILTQKDEISNRIKKLNISYNFQRFNIRPCYNVAIKPIRSCHFHLAQNKIEFFVFGRNYLNKVLVPDRFIEILGKHQELYDNV